MGPAEAGKTLADAAVQNGALVPLVLALTVACLLAHLQAPLMCLIDRVTNFAPTAVRGGHTPAAILAITATNGMRLVEPLADFVLGLQLLQQAKKHVCPWKDHNTCCE